MKHCIKVLIKTYSIQLNLTVTNITANIKLIKVNERHTCWSKTPPHLGSVITDVHMGKWRGLCRYVDDHLGKKTEYTKT